MKKSRLLAKIDKFLKRKTIGKRILMDSNDIRLFDEIVKELINRRCRPVGHKNAKIPIYEECEHTWTLDGLEDIKYSIRLIFNHIAKRADKVCNNCGKISPSYAPICINCGRKI